MSSKRFIKGVLAGFALGVMAGVLVHKKRKRIMKHLWKWKAAREIMRRVRAMGSFTREQYEDIVDDVLSRYRRMKDVSKEELQGFAGEMKHKWRKLKEAMQLDKDSDEDDEDEDEEDDEDG